MHVVSAHQHIYAGLVKIRDVEWCVVERFSSDLKRIKPVPADRVPVPPLIPVPARRSDTPIVLQI